MRHVIALVLWIAVAAVGAATAYAQRGGPYGSGGKEPNNDDAVVESFNLRGLVVLVVIALAIAVLVTRHRRRKHARVDRERRVAAAAREAARDDPAFAPAAVKAAAAALFTDLQRAWSERDDEALERRLGPELLAGWRRSLKRLERRGQRSQRLIVDGPRVSYVGLVNREGTEEDRATVAIEAVVQQVVRGTADDGALVSNAHVTVNAYWTLGRDGDGWRVLAIDGEQTAPHYLNTPIVPLPEPEDGAGPRA